MTEPVTISVRVEMSGRDITPWCESVTWGTPTRYLEQEFEITTHAWHMFDVNARYDIYATYDDAAPYNECVIRQGHILPDQVQAVQVAREEQPLISVRGKSWSSSSFRRAPRATFIIVPFWGAYSYNFNLVRQIMRKYDGVIGRYQIWNGRPHLASVLALLCGFASFGYVSGAPRYPMQPVIIPPGKTYWDAMLDLIEPFALDVYYDEWHNSLHFVDPIARQYWRPTISIPGSLVEKMEAKPINVRKVRRVLVKVPSWR